MTSPSSSAAAASSPSSSMEEKPQPSKIVAYPIAGDETGGALFLYDGGGATKGKTKPATNLFIMSAGYPDDHENFMTFAARIANETPNALVGLMCLPGYDDRPADGKPWTAHAIDGYSFDEMVAAVREAVKVLLREAGVADAAAKQQKSVTLTGVFHDWAVAPGLMWTNRTLQETGDSIAPDQLVIFDVMLPHHPKMTDVPVASKPTLYETAVTYIYRIILALTFAIQRYLSKILASIFFAVMFLPLGWVGLAPCKEIDNKVFESRKPPMDLNRMIYMAYPYYYTFKDLLLKGIGAFADLTLPLDLQQTPILYLYGTEKNIMFHDQTVLAILEREAKEKRSKTNAIAVPDAGHWLYIQQPDVCMKEIKQFLETSK